MNERAVKMLVEAQNADGGWGALKGRHSNTESTSLAIIALRAVREHAVAPNGQRGVNWLIQRQRTDGSWPLSDLATGSSWTSALAILTLANSAGEEERALKGARWALEQEGSRFGWLTSFWIAVSGQRQKLHLNPDLKGWPWTAGSFSWVEPTSYFLLALKKLRSFLIDAKVDERIRQGEMLLYDRMCEGGGWNYGNVKVLGETLWPYPDVTAVALVALQDHHGREATKAALRALHAMLREVESGFALSWGIICLSLYGEDVAQWRMKLSASFEKTGFLSETKTLALSLLALNDPGTFRLKE
jgi:hypothetical protein